MLRVVIVADTRVYREGVAELLRRQGDVEVVGTTSRLSDALRQVERGNPAVVLVDMTMSDSHTVVRTIVDAHPQVKVVALAVTETDEDVLACAECGVAGYVPQDGSAADLLNALRDATHGELRCSPEIAASLLQRVAALSSPFAPGPANPLTARESDVLGLIEQGLSNKEIAQHLGIEVATVKNHVHNILEKLHVHHRAEAAARVRGRSWRRPKEAHPKSK